MNTMTTKREFGEDAMPLPTNLKPAWEEFLRRGFNSWEDAVDAVFRHPLLFPLQRRREMEVMFDAAQHLKPRVFVEIGADKGGSVFCWLKRFPSLTHVVVCEVRGCPYADAFRAVFPNVNFLFVEGSSYSQETVRRMDGWLTPREIDVLFIDGNKERTWEDFVAYRDRMRRPGIVFVHDIKDAGPGAAFERVRSLGRHACEEIDDISESIDAMERQGICKEATCEHENWLRVWKGESCGCGVIRMNNAR